MRRLAFPLLAATLLASAARAAPVAEVAPANLPPEAMVVAALDNHPTVAAAGQRVAAARAAASALARGSHEVLVTGTIQARDVTNERRYQEFDAQVLRPIRLPGKATLDREAGVLGVDVAHNRMEDSRHQAALLLAQLWFDWLTAGELHRVDQANVALLDQALAAVARRQQLRDAAALDVDQARAARDQAQGAAAMSAADMAQARALLAANFPDLPLPDAPPPLGAVPTPANDLVTLRDLVIARSHEIGAADREAARLDTLARRAERDRVADPSLGFRAFSERGGMERGGGLVLQIPLGGGYRKALAQEAGAQASAGMLDLANVRRQVEAMADGDLANAGGRRTAWEGIAASARSTIQAAERTARGQQLGAIDLADALLARRQAHEAARLEVAARSEAIRSVVKLEIDSHVIWADEDTDEHPS
jgi:outer membrane protein TolC